MDSARRKRELRERMRSAARSRASRPDAIAAGRAAARAIASLPEFEAASTVAMFAALRDEIPTRPLFDLARAAGKRVVLPRCGPSRPVALSFALAADWADLVPGAFGALEPADSRPTCALEQVEMLVVPGLAFDRSGGRLGRGGGYYDRALASVPVPFVCGLAYAAQIVDLVPTTELDVEMDAVATEQGVVRTGRARRRRGMRE